MSNVTSDDRYLHPEAARFATAGEWGLEEMAGQLANPAVPAATLEMIVEVLDHATAAKAVLLRNLAAKELAYRDPPTQ